jgi:hypothetical protein
MRASCEGPGGGWWNDDESDNQQGAHNLQSEGNQPGDQDKENALRARASPRAGLGGEDFRTDGISKKGPPNRHEHPKRGGQNGYEDDIAYGQGKNVAKKIAQQIRPNGFKARQSDEAERKPGMAYQPD